MPSDSHNTVNEIGKGNDIGKGNKNRGGTMIVSSRMWLTLVLLFSYGTLFVNATLNNGSSSNSSSNSNNKGFVSLKLNSRHTELERRRRERRRILSDDPKGDMEELLVEQQEYYEDRFRRREEAVQVGALFEGYGTHYVDLWCGSPPQRQTVIVDTGSGVTAFPCSGCNDCGVPDYHIDRLFAEKESTTFRESTCTGKSDCIMQRSNCADGTCKIGMSYAEGSRWNAYEAVDKCYVGGPHEIPLVSDRAMDVADSMDPNHAADLAFDMTFGCQTLVTGLFKTQLADGIMGMSNQASTFWSQMFRANKMGSKQQFSLCFSRPPEITKEGTEAGAMTLGGSDERLHNTPMVFTPRSNQGRGTFFSVKVRRMMLRDGKYGESAKSTDKNPNKGIKVLNVDETTLNKGGIIVDSGTTDTYWVNGIGKEFNALFQQLAGRPHHNQAMSLTEDDIKKFPTILIQLYSDDATNGHVDDIYHTPGLAGALDSQHPSDVILAIPPSHYMEYNPDKDTYTSRFYPTERSGSVLGANAMMGHDVFFDMDTMRIGWAESDCDYTKTVTDNGYDFEITGNLEKRVKHVGMNNKDKASLDREDHNKHSNNKNYPDTAPTHDGLPKGDTINSGNDVDRKNHNKHSNNKSKDTTPTQDELPKCDTITSGNKCQKIEGCTWGWGKCTLKSEAGEPTEPPTYYPTMATTESEENDSSAPQQIIDVDALIEQSKQHQSELVVAGLIVSLLLCCCCYSLCCRKSKSSVASNGKYSRTAVSASVEMTNGTGFQDEPNDEDEDEDEEEIRSMGSRTSSQFRDNPDSEPEFEGDFA